jgi:hypothetical protein
MKPIWIVLLIMLLLLPASHLGAYEVYSAEVCNKGQLGVDVAVAYRAFGFNDEFWVIDGWYGVPPGKCKAVFAHEYADNRLEHRSFPVHLAFAFTDSTGVWGTANVKPPGNVAASRLQLCVTRKNFEYRVDTKDPATACKGQPNSFLIRASIDHEPKNPDYFNHGTGVHYRGLSATVALGANDRAIPLGPQASTGGAAQGPGTSDEFYKLLRGAMNALHYSEETLGPGGYVQLKPGYRLVFACADRSVVAKELMSNLQSARAKTLTNAVRKFLESHGRGTVRFKVKELNGALAVEQIGGKTGDCVDRGELEFAFQNPEAGAVIGSDPAPKPAPQPDPGFGDLVGPGGFVKPPSR